VKIVFRAFLICTIALVLAAGADPRLRAAEIPTVEVGLPQDGLFGLGGRYIIDNKLDQKNGFVMRPRWAGVPEIQRLLGIQAISVGLMTPEAGLRANAAGIPIRLLQPYQTSHMFVLTRVNSPYQTADDLRGKPVALLPEVTTLYNLFDFIMRKRGFNIERDFQLKKLAGPAIVAVLEKGDVEAGLLWESHVSRLVGTGRYKTIMSLREEMNKLLSTNILPVVWLGGLDPWIKSNRDLVSGLRAAWTEAYRGVQKDESHFRKYAKQFFGLDKAEDVSFAWPRTKVFLLPEDFKWPEPTTLKAMKSFLQQGIDLGMYPKEAAGYIDGLFTP
jgi:ABC-type nitrate/sulfonate/bicarbonate transport system substrate-binding protein